MLLDKVFTPRQMALTRQKANFLFIKKGKVTIMDAQIIAIQNVHGYVDSNGTAWLNAEDVARGLGFIEVKTAQLLAPDCGAKTYETIRWRRINDYLREFGFEQQVTKGSFIPENMFYRLAMKARNETAERFQAKVADEILPQIRKTGMYGRPLTRLEAYEELVRIEKQRLALEEAYHAEQERADNAEREAKANQDAKDLQDQATKHRIGYDLGKAAKFLNVKELGRNRLFKFLRDNGDFFYDRNGYNTVKQSHVNQKRFFEYIDETYEYPVIYISPKGMRYVLKALINAGYKPQITAEEWERKCQLDQEEEEE